LAAGAEDSDEAEDEGVDPARAATEAMAATDNSRDDYCGEVDDEFEDRNGSVLVETTHGEVVVLSLVTREVVDVEMGVEMGVESETEVETELMLDDESELEFIVRDTRAAI